MPFWYPPALALQFLTRLPISLPGELQEADFVESMPWYPVIGGLLGAFFALCGAGLIQLWTAHISAAVVLALGAIVTGNLHLDGLMDSCDGLYGGYTPQRRLEIMRDSRAGVHGVTAGVVALLLKWLLLWTLLQDPRLLWSLPLVFSASRWSLVFAAKTQAPAKKEGLGGMYARHLLPRHLVWATAAWILIMTVGMRSLGLYWQGLCILVIAPVVTALFGRHVRKMIGGLTGDTLGATSELVELAALLILCVGVT